MIIRLKKSIPTDAEYIQAFREDDNALINWFYRQYRENIYCHLRKEFGIRLEEDREDIFQEAVARLWENIQRGKLSEESLTSSLYTYFKSIADHVTQEHIRKQKNYVVTDIENEPIGDVDRIGLEKMYDIEDKRAIIVRRVVNEMGKPCKPLLIGFLWMKKSMASLAEELGYSGADSAKTQKSKCMVKLTAKIKTLIKSNEQ